MKFPSMLMLLALSLASGRAAQSVESTNLHNLFMVTPQVYSGSSPDSHAAWAELARRGVKTIISVDGAKPDVETARQHGLRYIHLPFGYDRIPSHRVAQLVQIARTAEGPFYVHCHHGRHRGPAAVAVMCSAVEGWTPQMAEAWLRQAGTSVDYPGLYRSAREFRLPAAAEMAAAPPVREFETTSSLVTLMVEADGHFARLRAAQKSGWKDSVGSAGPSMAGAAGLLRDTFREMIRLEVLGKSRELHDRLVGAEKIAEELRSCLGQESNRLARAEEMFKQLNKSCVDCHRQHRD